jgi:hypothetical protein
MVLQGTKTYAQKFTEYEVKAVYLYQFVKFVQWPENTPPIGEEFVIGIYGEDPFGDLPAKIYANKKFKGKNCKIVQLETMEDALQCKMVFISNVEKYKALKLINYLDGKPILVVGDNLEEFCQMGGMINFTEKTDKYRFEINQHAAKKSQIQISSKLFAVARLVETNTAVF